MKDLSIPFMQMISDQGMFLLTQVMIWLLTIEALSRVLLHDCFGKPDNYQSHLHDSKDIYSGLAFRLLASILSSCHSNVFPEPLSILFKFSIHVVNHISPPRESC